MQNKTLFLSILLLLLTPIALAADPGNPDTCRVEQILTVGSSQQVAVEVFVYNDAGLGGVVIPLIFHNPDNSDVYFDSVHWSSRFWVNPASLYGVAIDSTNHKISAYATWFSIFDLPLTNKITLHENICCVVTLHYLDKRIITYSIVFFKA